MLKRTITISTINSQILQNKKIIRTEVHKHSINFRISKSDKEHEQWVIILWNMFGENYEIFISCVLHVIFIFTMICNVYCLSYAVFLLVLTVIVICMIFVFLCVSCVVHLMILVHFFVYIDISIKTSQDKYT